MPRVSEKRLTETVDVMEDEWLEIIDRTGDLTLDDMLKSLHRYRYRHGSGKIVIPQNVDSPNLMRMNQILTGDMERCPLASVDYNKLGGDGVILDESY